MCVSAEPGRTTIKTLFAFSSNVCAMRVPGMAACEEKLSDPAWQRVKGEVAHIRGERPGSARYDPSMTDGERAAYENLILLCPNHHKLIDFLEPDTYTIELLEEMKYGHEQHRNWAPETRLEDLATIVLEDLGVLLAAPRGGGAIRNLAGVRAETFSDQAVENLTPPALLTTEDGDVIVTEEGSPITVEQGG